MKNDMDYLSESDKKYLHTMLDKVNVPRVSPKGKEFTLFGRILLLVEKFIENNLLHKRQDNISNFVECADCKSKPGSPVLCDSCYNNRSVIASLERDNRFYKNTITKLKRRIVFLSASCILLFTILVFVLK